MMWQKNINIAYRFSDCETICYNRWVNTECSWIGDNRMISGNREFIKDYLDPKFTICSIRNTISPERDGLLIFDCKTSYIFSMLDYSFHTHYPMFINFENSFYGAEKFRTKLIDFDFKFDNKTEQSWDIWFNRKLKEMLNCC